MREATIAMVWHVPIAGHRWCEGRPIVDGHEHEANARVLVSEPGEWRRYQPLLDVPHLFRSFAELEFQDEGPACEEHVRRFADQYGVLGIGFLVQLPDGQARYGEELVAWYREGSLMHHAMKVWDALQADDIPTLERWFTSTTTKLYSVGTFSPDDGWPSMVNLDPTLRYISDEAASQFRHLSAIQETDPSDHWPDWPTGPVQWAMSYLRRWVNQQLEVHTSGRLQYAPFSPDHAPLQIAIIPKNLLGGLWLQFAGAIERELRRGRCAECGTWFRVKPKGNRSNTRFCQDYCRVKANRRWKREQQAKARQGHEYGAPVGIC